MAVFTPSREAGLAALERFVGNAGRQYAERRNYDFGPDNRDNVSMLSPYIRHRLVSEEEVVRAVLAAHSAEAAEKFIQEIFWRTYWKGWLEQRPSIWTNYQHQVRMLGEQQFANLDAALAGQTGIDCFDYWVNELAENGFLHNHARMWFASIWIFTLRLPWQLGAAHFLRHLFDGDPACNTLSWRWVAGLHTLGKHYVADADNIRRFTDGRFAPSGLSAAPTSLNPWPLPEPAPVAPLPPLPKGPFVLLISEEDLSPVLPAHLSGLVSAVMLCPLAQSASSAVDAFRREAIHAAAHAIAARLSVPLVSPASWSPAAWTSALKDYPAQPVLTAFSPVGPLQIALQSIAGKLKPSGHDLIPFRRAWDDQCWPLARDGFFRFRQNIPALLRQLAKD